MLVISFREFREKQGFFLDKVKQGEDVILRARDGFSARLQPITDDDTLMSKEEYFAKLDNSLAQYERGEYISMKDGETVENFVNRIVCTN